MKIKELLADKSKWTQGRCARDKDGDVAPTVGGNAVCWCLLGAIIFCYRDPDERMVIKNKILNQGGIANIATFNDSSTYEEIFSLVNTLDI